MNLKTVMGISFGVSFVALIFLIWLIYGHESPGVESSFNFLPKINASLNSLCALFLLFGFWAVKNKKISLHKKLMTGALLSSICFLICYIIYHYQHGDTPFTGTGWIRSLYFFILVTHIIGSIINLPMILTTYILGFTNQVVTHRKFAKWTFPLWLYVSVTGVLVYFLLNIFI